MHLQQFASRFLADIQQTSGNCHQYMMLDRRQAQTEGRLHGDVRNKSGGWDKDLLIDVGR